jgi:hypothetical protein
LASSAASEFIFRFRLWHTPDTSVDLSWLDGTQGALISLMVAFARSYAT